MPEPPAAQFRSVTFDVPADAAEGWADALLAGCALSVDAADAGAGTPEERPVYGEPDASPWPIVRLTALFADDARWEQALARAAASAGMSLPAYAVRSITSTDWVRASQAQFAPIRVSERLWIMPSWCTPPDPAAIAVTLDPGLAFGTGGHPSTLLCLRWLARDFEAGGAVLDYGCGSGILAIAAAKLGAGRVLGIDIDPQAIAVSRANAEANSVSLELALADEAITELFDVVLANILANPLELLAPLLAGRVRPGGRIVLSGVLEAQAGAVLAAYERWFKIGPWGSADGWVALAGVRNAR